MSSVSGTNSRSMSPSSRVRPVDLPRHTEMGRYADMARPTDLPRHVEMAR